MGLIPCVYDSHGLAPPSVLSPVIHPSQTDLQTVTKPERLPPGIHDEGAENIPASSLILLHSRERNSCR
jgi:hypothetical protein